CEFIGNGYFQVSGEFFFSTWRNIPEIYFLLERCSCIPHFSVESRRPTMQPVTAVILFYGIFFAVQMKTAMGNTISKKSYGSTMVLFVSLQRRVNRIKSQYHISEISGLIRS